MQGPTDQSEAAAKRRTELRLLKIANQMQNEREARGASVERAYVPSVWRRVLRYALNAWRWLRSKLAGKQPEPGGQPQVIVLPAGTPNPRDE